MREDIRTASAVVDGASPKHCGNASAAEVPGVTRQAVVEPRRQVPRGCSREGGVKEKMAGGGGAAREARSVVIARGGWRWGRRHVHGHVHGHVVLHAT